jgi:uroporphyrinogen-III synthase
MPDTVVITRPRAQAAELAAGARALGREVLLLPLLEILPLEDTAPLAAALATLDDCALVAFVSPNAIDAAFAVRAHWPHGIALAVLGEGSRAALARHGVGPHNARIIGPLDAARSDSESLLEALDLEALRGRRVLIVRGDSGRELLADALRAAGALVQTVSAYRRRVPPLTAELAATLTTLLTRPNDWIITSSEALRGLLALVDQLAPGSAVAKMRQQHLIVPHPRIAEMAKLLGLSRLTLTGSGDARLLAALQLRP